jgi:glycosyltransferase involved in cell wall biosynthesis
LKTLFFHRDFRAFTGGHLKVWDYFQHTKASGIFEPVIYMTPDSLPDESNPWVASGERISNEWDPNGADALFLAGMDWQAVPENCDRPVINLIQGLRHSCPDDPRNAFLSRAATRVCVSKQVADAILSTGLVNGPVITIPAGVDMESFPETSDQRDIPVLIAGLKKPAMAKSLSEILTNRGVQCVCLTRLLPRAEFLRMLGRARITVFLPQIAEGFYLPALEGMAMGTLVVCPDCVGNRGFCSHGINCLQPSYDIEALGVACVDAFDRTIKGISDEMIKRGHETARLHSLDLERDRYQSLLLEFQ